MRIGVSSSRLDLRGGMERYALTLANGLLDRGIEVVAFCRRADPGLPETRRLRDIRRVPVCWLPGKFRPRWFSWRLDRLRRGAGLDLHIACCLLEHPDIAVCGGTHRGYLAAMGKKPGRFDRWTIDLEDRQYANARLIVAHSRLMRDELVSLYGVEPARIRLIYPPVDAGRFRPAVPEERLRLRREFGFPDNRRVFLFVSGGHVRKGFPFLREFFTETDLPVELAVAGRPAGPGRNIRGLGFSSRIEALYQAADAVILASAYEPFGLVGAEAALCGTPVVLAENVGCCEVLSRPLLHTFRAGDRESLAAAIRETLAAGRPEPARLGYDPGVQAHLEALLRAAEGDQRAARE
ncbi:MAG: glycosyltransferase family 4 protein [Planctomycetota bacterium]|jgi:glycosyltransferase involved in cell wall biosynthesis|nr:glycosyltransferase family 4 protein [Planctomycetota bacterium]